MVVIILALSLLIPVVAGSAFIIQWMIERAQLGNERLKSLQAQRAQAEALNAIQLAKAWEKAMAPDPTPALEAGPPPEVLPPDGSYSRDIRASYNPPRREDYQHFEDYIRAAGRWQEERWEDNNRRRPA